MKNALSHCERIAVMKNIFILVGPSGGGKSVLLDRFVSEHSDFTIPPTMTTRPKRPDEGKKPYIHVDDQEFMQAVNSGELLEWAPKRAYKFGVVKEPFEQAYKHGDKIITELELKGMRFVKKQYRDKVLTFFIDPGSIDVLRNRILNDPSRKKTTAKELAIRMSEAEDEMKHKDSVDIIIENKDGELETAYHTLENAIMTAAKGS